MTSAPTRAKRTKLAREYYLPWGGWFPHPELDTDIIPRTRGERIADAVRQEKLANIRIPAAFTFNLPDGLPLSVFRRHPVRCLSDATLPTNLTGRVTKDTVLGACTVDGEGRVLRMLKPDDGVFAFIWRLARFHTGLDLLVPLTAFWDVVDSLGKVNSGIVTFLDAKALELADATGGDSTAAIGRWGRVLGRV